MTDHDTYSEDALLASLNIDKADIARYNYCYFDGERIVIRTRTGGGNRENYMASNNALARHACCIGDCDQDTDPTYALFYFTIPPQLKE